MSKQLKTFGTYEYALIQVYFGDIVNAKLWSTVHGKFSEIYAQKINLFDYKNCYCKDLLVATKHQMIKQAFKGTKRV